MDRPHEPSALSLTYLLDENMGRSLVEYLVASGNTALESRDVVGPTALDSAIEFAGIQENLVILTHDRDFKTNVRRAMPKRLGKLASVVLLHVRETRALQRFEQCHHLINTQFIYASTRDLKVELIDITEDRVSVLFHFPRESIGQRTR